MAVSELVTTCLMLVPCFKWEYTVLGAISIRKKYKMSFLSLGSLQSMQRHHDLNYNTHVLVQDNKKEEPIIKKGQSTSLEEEKYSSGKHSNRLYHVNKGRISYDEVITYCAVCI